MPLPETLLPPAQMLRRKGGHAWSVWPAAAFDVFRAIDAKAARKP
jgi:hypothetical protein